jgi:hypothetical protein
MMSYEFGMMNEEPKRDEFPLFIIQQSSAAAALWPTAPLPGFRTFANVYPALTSGAIEDAPAGAERDTAGATGIPIPVLDVGLSRHGLGKDRATLRRLLPDVGCVESSKTHLSSQSFNIDSSFEFQHSTLLFGGVVFDNQVIFLPVGNDDVDE